MNLPLNKSFLKNKPRLLAFLLGFKSTLPLIAGVLPFGMLYATLANSVGFPPWLIVFISIVVFGGSSQLVFIDLFQTLSSTFQAVLGSNIVNARHLIYSAGVSSHFSSYNLKWRLLLSYLLTDQLYAISETHKKTIDSYSIQIQPWFYFGSGFCTWSSWVLATIAGIIFGQAVPSDWNLAFSIPLMFLPLIFMTSRNLAAFATCLFSVGFVVLFFKVPFGLGVLLAILLSSFFGYQFQKYWRRRR